MAPTAQQFLVAYRHEQFDSAAAILAASPDIARASLTTACAVGDLHAVREWLARDRSLATQVPPDDAPPLIYAVAAPLKRERGVSDADHVALVTALLDAGADANTSIEVGEHGGRISALYFPAVANLLGVAQVLLERGANPNDGESVYHAAQHNHREMLALLLKHGADLSSAHSEYGNTALYFLATHRVTNPITPSVIHGMEWLLQHGADPNVPSYKTPSGKPTPAAGETPLQRAAASGLGASVMRMLIAHGADVHATRADGKTAYALAVRAGNTDAARALRDAGADTSALSPVDELVGACATADASTAKRLVAADPNLMQQLSAEDRATLVSCVGDGLHDSVALMISLGWPLTDESEWGGTPLHWAAWHGRQAMVTQLIAAGAPVNVRDSAYGSSPIAWAAHGSRFCEKRDDADYVSIVRALMAAGATKAEAINKWGESPISMAESAVVACFRDGGWDSPS